jgi:hypothetical protein
MHLRAVLLPALAVVPLLACSSSASTASNGPLADSGSPPSSVDSSIPVGDANVAADDAGASGNDDASGPPLLPDGGDAGPDLDMQASDFDCILSWPKVGDYRITNKLGNLSGSLAIANAPDGGVFPVGTVVQLIPDEAMVKRYVGFNAASDDWEFFNLSTSASGTTINQRGGRFGHQLHGQQLPDLP